MYVFYEMSFDVWMSSTIHSSNQILCNAYSVQKTNAQNNLQILHKAHKDPKLLEQFDIYKHHRTHKNEILND